MRPISPIDIEFKVFNLAKNGEIVNYGHDIISWKAKNCHRLGTVDNVLFAVSIKGVELTARHVEI